MTFAIGVALVAFIVVMVLRAIPTSLNRPDRTPRRRGDDAAGDKDVTWYVPWTWSDGDSGGDGGSDGGGGGGD